ncbi:hypothetical protein PRUPE_6G275800 [Prunus persica]|uniref:Uncharacterized protein n=1 Tax=Prunus persica TaxID=3760 RepID=M5W4I3_PRUPE|nr:hypothetical protein PRUPE_6G275800 [Prunus persica]
MGPFQVGLCLGHRLLANHNNPQSNWGPRTAFFRQIPKFKPHDSRGRPTPCRTLLNSPTNNSRPMMI